MWEGLCIGRPLLLCFHMTHSLISLLLSIMLIAQDSQARFDVTALLVGLIAGAVALVIVGLLIWYGCQRRAKDGASSRGAPAR